MMDCARPEFCHWRIDASETKPTTSPQPCPRHLHGEAEASPRHAKPARVRSARVRIVGSLVASVAVALGISITISHLVSLQRLDQRIDRELTQEVTEVAAFAATGIDPVTARPFTDVGVLLRECIELNVVGRNETMIALVNGQPYARNDQDPPLRLDEQPEVVARLAASSHPELATVQTARGAVRYGTVPVRVAGSPDTGIFVIAVFRDLERAEINSATGTSAAVAFGTLALAAIAALWMAGRVLRPIRLVRLHRPTDLRNGLVPADSRQGNDDVAELARTFNSMLDRLETTFAAQRQFLHDASHELRTPITIVQGHLELAESDPSTRAESLAIVMDELERMRRIVEDLLMLARSDSPNFLRLSAVDLEPYIDEVLDKARVAGPKKVVSRPPSRRRRMLDRQRITQALLQLALNATQHTTTDQEIHLGTEILGISSISGYAIPVREYHWQTASGSSTGLPAGTASMARVSALASGWPLSAP